MRAAAVVGLAVLLLVAAACAGGAESGSGGDSRGSSDAGVDAGDGADGDGTVGEGTAREDGAETTDGSAGTGDAGGTVTEVIEVVDGDTLKVATGETVRLIGMDTPETRHPDLGVQCYGREATAFITEVVPPGTEVRLVGDVEQTDRYGRTLAYVYRVSDGLFVNLHLLTEGFAQVATFPPNVAHVDEFVVAQREAREAGRGLWSACEDELDLPPDTQPGGGGGCDPSYPDICLPPPPPDLDCGDLDVSDVVVLPPDPHQLDGNGDGRGCEG